MEKPNAKDYQYSDGELKDPMEYIELMECYYEFMYRDFNKKLFERKKKAILIVNDTNEFDKRDARIIINAL